MEQCECMHQLKRGTGIDVERVADEGGLTAVIEFLSAFTLFLMILTAFISLAQLQMGPNDPEVDRLDRAAAIGLDRLTGGEGWFVPYDASGGLDVDNGTSDWHQLDAATLTNGRLQAGLLGDGIVDDHRISALRNVTETGMAQGLGLGEGLSLHLSVTGQQHTDANQTGSILFEGGTERASERFYHRLGSERPCDGNGV